MSYVDDNLVPGEQVMYRTHLHWKIFLAAVWPALLAIVMLVLAANSLDYRNLFLIAAAVFGVLALLFIGRGYLKRMSNEFAVTDKRVLIKTGMIDRSTVETLLSKVENIRVEQSMMGRMLGYGTIQITGTGGTTESFHDISNPLEFRKQVQAETISYDERRETRPSLRDTAIMHTPTSVPPEREERECPYCAEPILARAKVCKHCGRDVSSTSS